MRSKNSNTAFLAAASDPDLARASDVALPEPVLIRIDSPAIVSTRSCPVVPVRGWLFIPPSLEAEIRRSEVAPILELLVESAAAEAERNPLLTGVRLAASSVGSSITLTNPFSRILRLGRQIVAYHDRASGVTGSRIEFDGEVDLSQAISGDELADRFRIVVCCRLLDRLSCSNPVTVCFVPPERHTQPQGGFLLIEPVDITAPFIQLRGWAAADGDRLKCAKIVINGSELKSLEVGIESPELAEQLPDIESSSNSIFEGVISAAELAASGVDLSAGAPPLLVSVRVYFHSGSVLELDTYMTRFRPAAADLDRPGGMVEQIELCPSGEVKISGWLLNPSYSQLALRFSTRRFLFLRNQIPLVEDERRVVRRFERAEIDLRYPLLTDGRAGFEITVTPKIFGRIAGRIGLDLVDSTSGAVASLIPSWLEGSIDRAIRSQIESRSRRLLEQLASLAPKFIASNSVPVCQEIKRSKRIVLACHNLSAVEGAPKVVLDIARALVSRGDTELTVVCGRGGELEAELARLGVEIEIIAELDWAHQTWTRYSAGLTKAAALFKQIKPKLVFAGVSDSFWAIDLASRLKLPSLWCIQEGAHPYSKYPDFDSRLRKRFLAALDSANRFVFVSNSVRQIFSKTVSAEKSGVIPNGVDLGQVDAELLRLPRSEARRTLGVGPNDFVLSIVGTTTRRKGQDIFLREAALVRAGLSAARPAETANGGRFRCFVVGARDSDYLYSLQATAQRLGLSDCLKFIPEQPGVGRYFIASDVAAICSREEAAPLVSLEAFAYGVPLVSTAVQGLSEQITDRQTGLFFDPEIEGDMAKKVLEIAASTELAQTLTTAARKSVETRFLLNSNIVGYLSEIDRLLSSR